MVYRFINFSKLLGQKLDLLLCVFGASCGIFIFYPGAMSGDSVGQWLQVLRPEILGTWSPPTMVYLWMAFNKIFPGPQGMLYFNYVIFFLSIYILASVFYKKLFPRLLFIVFMGFFPPLFFLNGVLWKDTAMLVSISMSIALLFKSASSRNKYIQSTLLIISIIFMLYGVSVRHNAIVCLLPYFAYIFSRYIPHNTFFKKILIILLTVVSFYSGIKLTHFANHHLIKESHIAHNMENSALIWDLWGMSVEINKNIIPDYVFNEAGKLLTIDEMKKLYEPYSSTILWHPYLNPVRWEKSFPDKKFKKDFLKLISSYPTEYIKVRIRTVLYMLGVHKPIYVAYHFHIFKTDDKKHWLYEASKDLSFSNLKAITFFADIAHFLMQRTPLYFAWIYLLLLVIQTTLVIIFKEKFGSNYTHFLFVFSIGMFYWLPYPIISASADFRYSNLSIYCSLVMLPLFIQKFYYNVLRSRPESPIIS